MRLLILELKTLISMAIMFVLFSLYFSNTEQLTTIIRKSSEVNFLATYDDSLNGKVLEVQK